MQELLNAAEQGTPSFFKVNLPIPFVLADRGVDLVARGKGLACRCPLHADTDPSFDTWLEESLGWRWNCPPCGKGGDVIDLLQELEECSFSAAMAEAQATYARMPAGWEPPVTASASAGRWDPVVESRVVAAAAVAEQDALWTFCSEKGLHVDPEHLQGEWLVGSRGPEIIIPYYNRQGELVAYKHRTADTVALAAPGSSLRGVLYGEWRDRDPALPVLLCEGESDCWAAEDAARAAGYVVLGLPGAGTPPFVQGLEGRTVLLGFDGDKAGQDATRRWSAALLGAGCVVAFLPVPEGQDLRSVQDLSALFRRTRSIKPAPDTIKVQGDIYVRPGKDTNVMLSNWRLDAQYELVSPEGTTAYRGILVPTGKEVVLTSADLSSKARIVSWSSRHGAAWLGSDRDGQALLAMLQAEGTLLPEGRMVDTAGLHDTAFVWPGGRAGESNLVYSPPSYDVHLESRLTLPDAPWTVLQITKLRGLHRQDVMDPILGWLAAAPFRALLPSFPTLAVTGSSGAGKTTLLQTVLQAFSGADISTNLTSTTKHALASFLACTNAFPVWFDEYRPGARKDTQIALEQLLRDAYTNQISAKGGMGERWSEISAMPTHAPIIVSGEDMFTETSHTERMVNLPLPADGKDPRILSAVRGWGDTGLPLAYLKWCAAQLAAGNIYLTPDPVGPAGAPTRQRDNLGTVAWGFALLDRFVQENGGKALGAPDLSWVAAAGMEAAAHNPIKDALLWALDEPDCFMFVSADTENVYVRVTSFVTHIEKQGAFRLPGRQAAVTRYLRDRYQAEDATHAFVARGGRAVSCLSIRKHLLESPADAT